MTSSHSEAGLTSPSVARNRDPILEVHRRVLPKTGPVLEIASRTGEHAVHFAAALPHLSWQPTDQDEQALNIIAAHRAISKLPNLLAPLRQDASSSDWPVKRATADDRRKSLLRYPGSIGRLNCDLNQQGPAVRALSLVGADPHFSVVLLASCVSSVGDLKDEH